jgi:hypothetical protein
MSEPASGIDFVDRTGRTTVTLLLRLLARSGEAGELVGHAEVVDTGEIVSIKGPDDLLQLVKRLSY